MSLHFPYPVLSKWGFEIHCAIDGDMDYISFDLNFSTGTQVKFAGTQEFIMWPIVGIINSIILLVVGTTRFIQ